MNRLLLVSRGQRRLREAWHPEFPTVRASRPAAIPIDARVLSASEWLSGRTDLFDFDARVGDAASGPLPPLLVDDGEPAAVQQAAIEILTRYQGALDRRNRASSDKRFQRALDALRERHDLSKPLVRADWCHALDTWQWLLRLAPDATLVLQLAALLHDVERLASESEKRVEQHATDYQRFKDEHARAGATLAKELLLSAGLEETVAQQVARLIEKHERPDADEARALLNDADALSFFSLNSHGFLAYYGPAHTRRKVEWTLARLSPRARSRFSTLRLSPAISELLSPRPIGGVA